MIIRAWLLAISAIWTSGLVLDGHQKIPKICTDDQDGSPKCEGKLRGEKLSCRGGFIPLNTKELEKTKTLSLCHWSENSFSPADILLKFPLLLRLAIRGGNVSSIKNDFPFSSIESVVLIDLKITYLQPTTFSKLTKLKILDLSRNLIQNLDPSVVLAVPETTKVYLAGNPWRCGSNLSWVLDKKIALRVADLEKNTCATPYPGKPVTKVLTQLQKMEDECPWTICKCSMTHIVWDTDTTFLHPVIAVNCTHRDLQVMPKILPTRTTTLYLGHNNISDLSPLARSSIFQNVVDVYLDHNQISNLDVLEGAEWLKEFRILSLKHNFISQVPTYALDNAFERNQNLGKLYLGGNPWTCNCDFTPGFQHLLIKYESVVRDLHDIKCKEMENNDHSLMPVMEVSKGTICYEPESTVNPLDILSGILASLIVLVLGKLIYDYWTFKRTGKLPWIVAKMP